MGSRWWVENLFRPLVLGAMFGCIAFSLAELVRLVAPDWSGLSIIAGCVLAALEANYSYRRANTRTLWEDVVRFRIVELLTLFILLKAMTYWGDGWRSIWEDLRAWPDDPALILDPETALSFMLALASWLTATLTAADLEHIRERHRQRSHHASPRESIASRFFAGGMVLMVLSGIARVGLSALMNRDYPPVPGLVLNVLIYYVLGLVLMGQVQFATLHAQWEVQGIPVSKKVAGRWALYSLIAFGLAALVAFVLPTRPTVGLLEMLSDGARLLSTLLMYAAQLMLFLVSLPLLAIAWLLYLLVGGRPPPQISLPGELQTPESSATGWPQWLHSLLFWVIALGIVGYVTRSYLRDHPEIVEALKRVKSIRVLLRLLSALWRRLAGLSTAIRRQVPRQLRRLIERLIPGPVEVRFFRLAALSARGRMLYYYLSILRRAARQGLPRRSAQTPHEYEGTLSTHLPQAQREVELLTESFVETRYSAHPVGLEQERHMRAVWKRVRAALRALKRHKEQSAPTGSVRDEDALNP